MAILTTACRQILCHRWSRFIHDQILMIYHEANPSENKASIARGQGRSWGQILRGQDQKFGLEGVGLEDLTSLPVRNKQYKSASLSSLLHRLPAFNRQHRISDCFLLMLLLLKPAASSSRSWWQWLVTWLVGDGWWWWRVGWQILGYMCTCHTSACCSGSRLFV